MRFSQLEGAVIGVWGAGREIRSLARQLGRRLPAARIAVAAFDEPPADGAFAGAGGAGPAVDGVGALVDAAGAAPMVVSVVRDGPERVVGALCGCDVVVRSPGVSIYRPELVAVRDAGVPITTATALWLAERGGHGAIGVTGTKGKSTTAAIVQHLARASGRTAALAGNIGVPALELLDREPAQVTVVELSSYQLSDLDGGPEVAVVTNLYREHTDWHGSEERYRADKLRILALPGVRAAVLGPGEALTAAVAAVGEGVAVRRFGLAEGWAVAGSRVVRDGQPVLELNELPLRGAHNALNLCAALSALEALGVEPPPLPRSLAGLSALPHRLEAVAERGGVLWVNDSISTTPESTIAALASFPGRRVLLIAGGQDRGQDYASLGRALAGAGAVVIGVPTTGARVVDAAREAGAPARATATVAALAEAVARARSLAESGDVVLLSPAAPSYDHYVNFEQRGARFRELVAGGALG